MRGKGNFFKPVIKALTDAGYEIAGNNASHFKLAAPGRPPIIVPAKLDDKRLAHRITRNAGVTL